MKEEEEEKKMLSYALFPLNKNLVFTIFYMDESLRNAPSFVSKTTGWRVASENYPDISVKNKTVNVRGKADSLDCRVATSEYESAQDIKDINTTLEEWISFQKGSLVERDTRSIIVHINNI